MLAEGLDLKGLSLCLFPLIFSYNRSKRIMFESEEALAKCFGYRREYVNAILKKLIKLKLIVRLSRHDGLQTYDYCVDVSTVVRMLGPPKCNDPEMLKDFYRSIPKPALQWCEKILHEGVRKVNTPCEKSSQPDVRKSNMPCEEILHNNDKDNNIDNKRDNVLSTLSNKEFIEILYPIFFFKNNCDPVPEIEKFLDYYRGKEWKLSGGKVMSEIEDLIRPAESWQVKEIKETGYRSSFMRGWKEVYKIAPEQLKKEILRIRPSSQNDSSASILCSKELADWLDSESQTVGIIFRGSASPNYKFDWERR